MTTVLATTLSLSSSEPVPNSTLERVLVMVPMPFRPVNVPMVVVPPLIFNGAKLLAIISPATTPLLVNVIFASEEGLLSLLRLRAAMVPLSSPLLIIFVSWLWL
ncbi:hypothetical protein D3C80_1258540 [compost metagenome]